jgi:hypothetical protein
MAYQWPGAPETPQRYRTRTLEITPETSADSMRAGDRDRTGMTSLEGWGSTIELRPRDGGCTSRSGRAVTGSVPAPASPTQPSLGRGPLDPAVRRAERPRPDR